LKTLLGEIRFEFGDYLIIPRGMIYQLTFDNEDNRLLIAESYQPITRQKDIGTGLDSIWEHSPFCERDFKLPQNLQTHDELGDFVIKVKKQGQLHHLVYASHPFDVVGLGWGTIILRFFYT